MQSHCPKEPRVQRRDRKPGKSETPAARNPENSCGYRHLTLIPWFLPKFTVSGSEGAPQQKLAGTYSDPPRREKSKIQV